MSEDPTLLLVHGAWCGGWMWEPVLAPLRERGVRVEVIEQLPSAGNDVDRLGDLHADAEHVRARLAEIAGPVVLCGQSYGGIVIGEVADHPAIAHSVYLAALWTSAGQSFNDLLGGEMPDWMVDRGDGSVALIDDAERLHQALFADLDADRAGRVIEQFVLQSKSSFLTPSAAPARSHPTTYVLCTEDQALPLEGQEAFSAAADHTARLQSPHCPMQTDPDALANVLTGVIAGSRAGAPVA
jgi:pimeloyl-ACP methyl ester carboxylesterase